MDSFQFSCLAIFRGSNFNGTSLLRKTHKDRTFPVFSIIPSTSSSMPLVKSSFYRTHSLWNSLPIEKFVNCIIDVQDEVGKKYAMHGGGMILLRLSEFVSIHWSFSGLIILVGSYDIFLCDFTFNVFY